MALPKRTVVYGGAVLDDAEVRAVEKVLRSGLQVGANVAEFERRCAALLGKRYGAMVNSGSSALMIAMRLLDLPPGSEVITSTLTFSTDVSSIVHAGYVPVFADCDADTYQIDFASLERCVGPKTKALLVPNLIGGIPDWDRLRELADRHGLVLVEDSCDTLGASFRGAPPGTRADLSLTSFSLYHIITAMGNGGMVCTDDARVWDRALTLRGWGRSSEPYLFGTRQAENDGRFEETLDGVDYDGLFIFRELGYGFVPSEAGAAFGLAQLEKLPALSARRAALFDRHLEFFRKHEDVFIAPRVLDGVTTTWICFPVQLRGTQLRAQTVGTRKALQVHLEDRGIATRMIFSGNVTRQPMLRGVAFRADPLGCPNADRIMANGVMLPCHPTMTDEDCAYLYEALDDFVALHR